ncbi:MAG: NAD-binding protein [Gemmatimonadales bacterium]
MRIVIAGASSQAVMTARLLADRGHELVVIDPRRERIDELADELDCGWLEGDPTRPDVLKEADPAGSAMLFCLTEEDQVNILTALVGRSFGFGRVVTSIQDPSYEALCHELELDPTIVPDRTIGRYLADLAEGVEPLELHAAIKGEGRFFLFVAGAGDAGPLGEIGLPEQAAIICLYRDGEFILAGPSVTVAEGDEVVILTHSRNLGALRERWEPELMDEP